jgi:tetratricopeptide (TPR) repeat protein
MNIAATIQKLQEAQGDPQKLALATLDIVLASHEPWMRTAMEAAAITHWFTPHILAMLLETDEPTAAQYAAGIQRLPMVETFPARGAWNVHEATRLALRSQLANEQPARFARLSELASALFTGGEPHEKIENVYHRMAAAPQDAAAELDRLYVQWSDAACYEPLHALGNAVGDLLRGIPLAQAARAQALLCFGWSNQDRLPSPEIEKIARESRDLFVSLQDRHGEAEARALLGDVLNAQGRRKDALNEYETAKVILLQLTQENPDNAGWLRDLSGLHSRIGAIWDVEGLRGDALREYEACKVLGATLTRQDPQNERWRRNLAVSHGNIGTILEANGQQDEALREYQAYNEIMLQLVRENPENLAWQFDLASSYGWVGRVGQTEDRREDAMRAYEAAKRIMLELTLRDPGNVSWQLNLSMSHCNLGGILEAEKRQEEALRAYEAAKQILLQLTRQDPGNVTWQRELSVSYNKVGSILAGQDRSAEALAEHQRSLEIAAKLAELDPSNLQWQADLKTYREWIELLRGKGENSAPST